MDHSRDKLTLLAQQIFAVHSTDYLAPRPLLALINYLPEEPQHLYAEPTHTEDGTHWRIIVLTGALMAIVTGLVEVDQKCEDGAMEVRRLESLRSARAGGLRIIDDGAGYTSRAAWTFRFEGHPDFTLDPHVPSQPQREVIERMAVTLLDRLAQSESHD